MLLRKRKRRAYEVMNLDQLRAYAIGRGVSALCKGWGREAIIRHIEAL